MSFGQWYTLEDVTQDLTRASGQVVHGLNEKYVVVGGQRPRHNKEEEEFEDMNNFDKSNMNSAENKPDLRGITELIRMVDSYSTEFESSLEEAENIKKMKDNFNKETVVITKLNPEVPAFFPKQSQGKNMAQKKNSKTKSLRDVGKKEIVHETKHINNNDANTHTKTHEKVINIPVVTKRDISSLDPLEKEKLQERLRSDISNTSQTNCVKVKRQRNLAIATLMKLFSSPSPTKTTDNANPKLITPQYFETATCDKEQLNKTDKNILDKSIDDNNKSEELETVNAIDKVNKWLERRDLSVVPDAPLNESENTPENSIQQTPEMENIGVSPTEVQNSIDKVSKWLSGPKETHDQNVKSPVLFVGPITFKRKHALNSPATQTSSSNETQISETIQNYVPSAYASELSNRYMKRMKEREGTKDIWTKLEEDLKLKDEILKNKSLSSLAS